MSNVMSLEDFFGRPVISVATAEEIGRVKSVVLDRGASRIERLHVAGHKRSPEVVEWSQVESVGADAVMIASEDEIHGSDESSDEPYVRGDIEIIGARVLDVHGYERGAVSALHFDADTGRIDSVMTDDGRMEPDRIRSLGTYALVVGD